MSSGIGFAFVVGLALLGAALVFALHRVARPTEALEARASEALRELEPRGGRHRFSVRLFEAAVLAAVWVTGIAMLSLWVPQAASLTPAGTSAAAAVGLCLTVATWWAWRRGALRSPRRPAAADEEGELP